MTELTNLQAGQKAVIVAIEGDRRYLSRITSIGLNIDCKLEMIQNVKARPLLVYGRDTMIAWTGVNRQISWWRCAHETSHQLALWVSQTCKSTIFNT